ncbi:MAG: hypothetical protein H0W55_08840 [Actinobacteria bacterium]|nr:hypothetical protein [Actinomycetota bacterium]MDQ3532848.1 hypothetical protein [Actinomycetota bacterium]
MLEILFELGVVAGPLLVSAAITLASPALAVLMSAGLVWSPDDIRRTSLPGGCSRGDRGIARE